MRKHHYCKAVEENYPYYCQIKAEIKTLTSNVICLSARKYHKGHEEGNVLLQAETLTDKLSLAVEFSKSCQHNFKFKIFNRDFMPQPCFRFDSDGDTHTNLGEIPLSKRQIRPPHFHEFDKSGIEFAYKTDILIKNESILLEDRSFALAHFSHEENIVYPQTIEFAREELFDPEATVRDPLSGEAFNE